MCELSRLGLRAVVDADAGGHELGLPVSGLLVSSAVVMRSRVQASKRTTSACKICRRRYRAEFLDAEFVCRRCRDLASRLSRLGFGKDTERAPRS